MKDMKRWTALAVALMLAVLPLGNVLADQAVPETFEGFSGRELFRAVTDWMDDAEDALYEAETEPELTERFTAGTESAILAMQEVRNRYSAGLIDASLYERLIETVYDDSIDLCDACMEALDRMLSDERIGIETYMGRSRNALEQTYGFAQVYLDALEQSVETGIMDETEYAESAIEALEDVMESYQDSFEICEELMEEGLIPTEAFLVSMRDLGSAAFRILDRRTAILSELYSAGSLEAGEFFNALEDGIEDRTEWIEAMTETASMLIGKNMVTEEQQLVISSFLLEAASDLIEEYLFYLDGMRSIGEIDDMMYNLMKSLMGELTRNIGFISDGIADEMSAA